MCGRNPGSTGLVAVSIHQRLVRGRTRLHRQGDCDGEWTVPPSGEQRSSRARWNPFLRHRSRVNGRCSKIKQLHQTGRRNHRATHCKHRMYDGDRVRASFLPELDLALVQTGISLLLSLVGQRDSDKYSAAKNKKIDQLTTHLLALGTVQVVKTSLCRYSESVMDPRRGKELLRLLRISALWGSRATPVAHRKGRKNSPCMCAACWNIRTGAVPPPDMVLPVCRFKKRVLAGACERRQVVLLAPLPNGAASGDSNDSSRTFDLVSRTR